MRMDIHDCHIDNRESRQGVGPLADRGASPKDFPSGRGSRGHGSRDDGSKTGRSAAAGPIADHAFGHDSSLSETACQGLAKEAGSQAGTRGPSSAATSTYRPATRASAALLPALPGPIEALPANPHALYRGHSRRDHSGRPSTRSIAIGARGARSWSNPRFPTPCRERRWATAPAR